MKAFVLSLLLISFYHPALSAEEATARLVGVINLPDFKSALLEKHPDRFGEHWLLREGERQGNMEVVEIKPETETVTLRIKGVVSTNKFPGGSDRIDAIIPGVALDNANMELFLTCYGAIIGRTLLRSPDLPAASFAFRAAATNRADAAQLFAKVLAEKGITTILDGDKFLLIVPTARAEIVKPRSSEIKSGTAGNHSEEVADRTVNFNQYPLLHAAEFYANAIGRKLDRSAAVPQVAIKKSISLKTQTALTKDELCYALETLFGWSGLKVIPDANGAKIVEISDAEK